MGETTVVQDLPLQAKDGEVLIGPLPSSQTVQGVTIAIAVSTFISAQKDATPPTVTARIVADLGDLQRQAGALVDTVALPTDNCARFSADNVVVRIWEKDLGVDGDTATLTAKGDADLWSCIENPFDHNNNWKNRLVNQPFTAALPFRLAVVDAQTVGIAPGDPTVDLGGQAPALGHAILNLMGIDLGGRLKAALDDAVSPRTLQGALPAVLAQAGLKVTSAQFMANGGTLTAAVTFQAALDAGTLVSVLAAVEASIQAQGGGTTLA